MFDLIIKLLKLTFHDHLLSFNFFNAIHGFLHITFNLFQMFNDKYFKVILHIVNICDFILK